MVFVSVHCRMFTINCSGSITFAGTWFRESIFQNRTRYFGIKINSRNIQISVQTRETKIGFRRIQFFINPIHVRGVLYIPNYRGGHKVNVEDSNSFQKLLIIYFCCLYLNNNNKMFDYHPSLFICMYSKAGCNYLQIHAGGNKSFLARVRQSQCDYQILSEVGKSH